MWRRCLDVFWAGGMKPEREGQMPVGRMQEREVNGDGSPCFGSEGAHGNGRESNFKQKRKKM